MILRASLTENGKINDFQMKTIDFKTCYFFMFNFCFPSGEPTIRVMQIEKKNISIFVEEMFIAKETCLIETISLFDIVSILFTKEL